MYVNITNLFDCKNTIIHIAYATNVSIHTYITYVYPYSQLTDTVLIIAATGYGRTYMFREIFKQEVLVVSG